MRYLSTALAITLALAGQMPAVAHADELLPDALRAPLELPWTNLFGPATAASPDEPPAALTPYDDALNGLLLTAPSPGLQFTFDPDNEEIFVGWQFNF